MPDYGKQRPTAETMRRWSPIDVQYRPSPGQLAFHQDRDRFTERGLEAGTGGGKTYAAAFEALDITLRERADCFILAAPDYPQMELSTFKTLKRLFGGRGIEDLEPYAEWSARRRTLYWWNGWEWRFASMVDPTSVEGLPDAAGVWLTEARLVKDFDGPDGAWLNLTRRLRGLDDRRRYAFFDTHSPTRSIQRAFNVSRVRSFDLPGPRGVGRLEVQDCLDGDRRVYQWGTRDAVAWGTLDEGSARRILGAYSGAAAARILEGRFAKMENALLGSWDDSRHLQPPPVHVERWSMGIDWGWTHPTAITLHAWVGNSVWTVAIVQEEHMSDDDVEQAIRGLVKAHGVKGGFVIWCGSDQPSRIDLLRRKGLEARAYVGKVADGITHLNSRLQGNEWYVSPACTEVRTDIDNAARKGDSATRSEDADAIDKDQYDPHALDSCRYGIHGESGKAAHRGGITW